MSTGKCLPHNGCFRNDVIWLSHISKAGRRALSWVDNGLTAKHKAKQVSSRASHLHAARASYIKAEAAVVAPIARLMQPVCQPTSSTGCLSKRWLESGAFALHVLGFEVCAEKQNRVSHPLISGAEAFMQRARGAQVIHQRTQPHLYFPLSLTLPAAIFSARDLKKPVGVEAAW
jgi:hypothetical protein